MIVSVMMPKKNQGNTYMLDLKSPPFGVCIETSLCKITHCRVIFEVSYKYLYTSINAQVRLFYCLCSSAHNFHRKQIFLCSPTSQAGKGMQT